MATIRLRYVNGFRDRHGRVRYYFRRRGERAIPLPGQPGSEEFMAAYAMALGAGPDQAPEIGASRTLPGTINSLVVDYYRSTEWNDGLADDTRKNRWHIIERFRAKHGDKRVALLRREHVEKMLAEIGRPSSKREWLKTIRGLLRFAVPTMLKVRSDRRDPLHQAPQEQGAPLVDRRGNRPIPRLLGARHAAAAGDGVRA
jgi:hypothetical protein